MARRKVVKYRRPININMGIIVFGIIFIYLIANAVNFLMREQTFVYSVNKKCRMVDDNVYTGVVLREENVMFTNTAGFISYFAREGDRVAKKDTIYTIDESGKLYEQLSLRDNDDNTLNNDDLLEIKRKIAAFKTDFTKSRFDTVYNFKYELENTVLELTNFSMISNIEEMMNTSVDVNSLKIITSTASGVVSYTIDSMEGLREENISRDTFDTTTYQKRPLRTGNLIESGGPVYKLITSENWSVIVLLNEEFYNKIFDKTSIKVKFIKDDAIETAALTVYEKEGNYYAKLDFINSMIRYISDRYLEVELIINSAEGLKIPISSIIEKEFYKIPLTYFAEGGVNGNIGVVKEVYSENGEKNYNHIDTEIYYRDETYGYIDTTYLNIKDTIVKPDSTSKFEIGLMDTLTGVYNVNKGYAVFKRIEKLYENNEYCIISDNTESGLALFDHIILNAEPIKEQSLMR